jgi:hypothetical protein
MTDHYDDKPESISYARSDAELAGAPEDSDVRAKLAFGAMGLSGVLMVLVTATLDALGVGQAALVSSVVLFPLICLLWPDLMAPVFSVVVVFWTEFVLAGFFDAPSVLGVLFAKSGPSWLTPFWPHWTVPVHLGVLAGAMTAGWATVLLLRWRRRRAA